MKNERYYYGILSSVEKEIYKSIYDGINRRALNICVRAECPREVVQEIYQKVLCDNPLFFFINQRVVRMGGAVGNYILMPEYLYTVAESRALSKDIRRIVTRVMDRADQFRDNKFRLEKCLHDSVVKSVAYDYAALNADNCYNAHSIVGAFIENKAVCEGIAKAFKVLCNMYGIKCMVVLGKASQDGNFGNDSYHAWNIVKLGRESYHVDATWDNGIMFAGNVKSVGYEYFNVTTKEIGADHLPLVKIPECNSNTYNYYYSTNSIISDDKELKGLIEERIFLKCIMFKVSEQYGHYNNLDAVLAISGQYIKNAMKKRFIQRAFALSKNEKMHTVCIRFL